jgi:hypothetical protein
MYGGKSVGPEEKERDYTDEYQEIFPPSTTKKGEDCHFYRNERLLRPLKTLQEDKLNERLL